MRRPSRNRRALTPTLRRLPSRPSVHGREAARGGSSRGSPSTRQSRLRHEHGVLRVESGDALGVFGDPGACPALDPRPRSSFGVLRSMLAGLSFGPSDVQSSSMRAPDPTTSIVGRDDELEIIGRWLEGQRPALLEIEGEAGIGKTTLWEEATRAAREAGAQVL